MHHPTLCAFAAAVLAALPGAHAGMYPKSSAVLQVDGKTYNNLVAKSNHTTILEFYAPWCGHCQKLQPAYEKAAKNLEGLANVAAIDCDDDANKQFCGGMGIKGFPTLKIIRPGKKAGKPVVEDYNGPRTAAGIVDAVVEKINNHVKRVTDKDLDDFLAEPAGQPKAILFTEKGTVSALLKSVAIDFLDVIAVGQIRSKESKAVEKFGVDKFPTLVLVPGGDKEPVKYDGPIKKAAMVEFLSQAGAPNPGTTAADKKADKKSDKKNTEKKSEKGDKGKQPEPEEKPETDTASESQSSTETVKAPVIVETALPIPTIHTAEKLASACLNERSNTCVLAFYPGDGEAAGDTKHEGAQKALEALAELAHKHSRAKRALFPFFAVPSTNEGGKPVLEALELGGEVELVAVNPRRGWWKRYGGADYSYKAIEDWIDAIRLGEGAKTKIPESLVLASAETSSSSSSSETEAEAKTSSQETKATDPTPEPETAAEPSETPAHPHEEL